MYEQFAKSYVLPSLGSVPLQELTPSHLERLYTRLLNHGQGGRPLAGNTVRRVHTLSTRPWTMRSARARWSATSRPAPTSRRCRAAR
jgi:hypothetical protein